MHKLIENAPGKIDIAYIQKMQGDNANLNAASLVPALAALQPCFEKQNEARAFDML